MFDPRPRSPALLCHPPQRSRSSLKSRSTQLLVVRFGWIVLVIWYEVGTFFGSLSGCRFPDAPLRASSSDTPSHIVLIADPHVPHPRLSHPAASPLLNTFRQGMEELFMRKSWNVVTRLGRIDAVVFVGDMLDQGRAVMSDNDYKNYHGLFRSIFKLPSSTPMYYVPGNHDIALGRTGSQFAPQARQRYGQYFSKPNAILTVSNHSIILLDAIGLVEEDYRRYYAELQFGEWEAIENGVIEFVQTLGRDPPPSPILISHIPLARAEAASCGPLREGSRGITKGVGPGFQNLLGRDTSRFLLEAIKPLVVFSGDDHDYCDLTHPNGVQEVSIKSFSSSAGIRRPGFQLLSLVPPQPGHPGHANVPCFLPDQLGVYTRVYLPLAILTVAYLLFTNIHAAWSGAFSEKRRYRLSDEKHRERPVPLTLPSRRSAQHLQSLTMSTRERQKGSTTPTPSAPPSPIHSPHSGYSPHLGASPNLGHSPYLGYGDVSDPEMGHEAPSPPMSRRSSYAGDLNHVGLFATPRRTSSGLLPPVLQPAPHRVAMPRLLSAADWASAARAKDMSVISLMADKQKPRLARAKAFFGWLWRTRKSVLGKSWYEVLSIALPAAVVWVIMNALFWRQHS